MNNQKQEKIYFIYILFGLLYFVSKAIFYICGFVYFRGIILGLIAAALTICVGFFAFREYKKFAKLKTHWLAVLMPLIIIPLTPIIMICNLGQEIFQIEKIAILIIFECLAIAQIILAVSMIKNLKSKT
jgi:positive regulator of sigma E activity